MSPKCRPSVAQVSPRGRSGTFDPKSRPSVNLKCRRSVAEESPKCRRSVAEVSPWALELKPWALGLKPGALELKPGAHSHVFSDVCVLCFVFSFFGFWSDTPSLDGEAGSKRTCSNSNSYDIMCE